MKWVAARAAARAARAYLAPAAGEWGGRYEGPAARYSSRAITVRWISLVPS
jgi:hypothetical protein